MINYQEGYRRYRRYHRNLRQLYERKPVRDFTFLVFSLLTAAFFGFFAIRPSLTTIGELVREIRDKREVSERLEQKINALSAAQREYASIQPELPIVYAALPKKSDFAKLAKQIEYLANKDKVLLLSFRIQGASLFGEEKEGLEPLNFDLAIAGQYRDLRKFLDNLESLERMVTVDGIVFSEKKTSRAQISTPLSLKVIAKGYYLQ